MANALNGEYEIIEALNSSIGDFGGPAFKAREVSSSSTDAPSGRIVLLRRLPDGIDREALDDAIEQSLLLLGSPNILETYGVTQIESRVGVPSGLYVVSEFLRGISLRERIRRVAPFSVATSLKFALSIVQALSFAQKKSIEHGSLAAEHVLLTPEGQVKIADFLVPTLAREASVHDSHVALGGDLRSLGLILYEMLVGSIPSSAYSGGSYSPRASNSGVPPAVDGIVRKAMSVDPSVKYDSISELLTDLQTALDDLNAGKPLNWSPMAVTPRTSGKHSGKLSEAASELLSDQADNDRSGYGSPILSKAIMAAFVVGVLAVIGVVIVLMNALTTPPDVTVPMLVGKTFDNAKQLADSGHFKVVNQAHEYSDVWPAGVVMKQSELAGREIKSGKTVDVTVSDGPPLTAIPDVTQVTLSKARKMIQDAGLPVGTVQYEYSDSVPKGIVTRQDPAAAAMVPHTNPVTIVVSKGPSPPPSPTGVVGSATVAGEIDLVWDPVENATTYDVYRDGKKLVSGLFDQGYSDTRLGYGERHTYSVSAVNVNGESAQSAPVSATTLPDPSAPPPVSAQGQSPDQTQNPSQIDNLSGPQNAPGAPPASTAPKQRQFHIRFKMPRRGDSRKVQIQVQDATGANVVYDEYQAPGDVVDQHLPALGNKVVIRIYFDGKLIKQEVK
jgi:hypothetical protein